MLKNRHIYLLLLVTLLFLCGCENTQEVASPSCADLETITDQAQRDELIKKCPRFTPKEPKQPIEKISNETPETISPPNVNIKKTKKAKHGIGFKRSQMKQW
jgi:entry exclusion lipoprotein TrbK